MRTVFVGGTGRSGTTIVAQLIGSHPAYRMIPIEVQFIVGPGGLTDLIEGRHGFETFRRKLLGPWHYRELPDGQVRGLHQILDEADLGAALLDLEAELARDRWGAGRRFVHSLLDPIAGAASGWVEMTPPNILAAPQLARLFPDARFVHAIRDGRDVACSIAAAGWGPDDRDESLEWWADRLEQSIAASGKVPAGLVHEIGLEALVRDDRERNYLRLLRFLELDDEPAMRRFFETSVTADRAHIGRWLGDVPPDARPAFDAHHRALLDDMRARGIGAAYPMTRTAA